MPTKTTSQPTSSAAVKAESTKTIGIRTLGAAMVLTSAVGILAILLAIGGGFAFMNQTSNDGASFLMAIGAALGIGAYTLGVYRLPVTSNA